MRTVLAVIAIAPLLAGCSTKASISPSLVDEYVRAYSRPGRMSAALEYYRALPRDADANRAPPHRC